MFLVYNVDTNKNHNMFYSIQYLDTRYNKTITCFSIQRRY